MHVVYDVWENRKVLFCILFLVQKTEVWKQISKFSLDYKYFSRSGNRLFQMSETTKEYLERRKAVVGRLQGRLPVPGSNPKTLAHVGATWLNLNFQLNSPNVEK